MDPRLVVRAQAGDREAFASLAAASIGRLNGVARLILRDRDAADDAVQDALVAAWRSLRALREPDRFEAWLNRLLVRACLRPGETRLATTGRRDAGRPDRGARDQ